LLSDEYFHHKNVLKKKNDGSFVNNDDGQLQRKKTSISQTPCFFKNMIFNNEINFELVSSDSSLQVEKCSMTNLDDVLKEERNILNYKSTIRNFARFSPLPKKLISNIIYKPVLGSLNRPY